MGFFGDLRRALGGTPEHGSGEMAADAKTTSTATRTANGQKIIPEFEVIRIEPHINGDRLEIWAHLKNRSVCEIEVDKINILGQRSSIGRFLKPNEQHEVRIYSGAIPTNDSYHKAELNFKIVENGDYFCADHLIHYHFQNGRYIPERLEVIHPIHDV